MQQNVIRVVGARQHNLKNITVDIPRDKMVRVTSLPKHLGSKFRRDIESDGIPVVMLRGDGQIHLCGMRINLIETQP